MQNDEQYQKEYDAAAAALEAAANGETVATTAEPEVKTEPVTEPVQEPIAEEVKTEDPAKQHDPVEELRLKLEKAEKALKDTQAWGTKNAQELARINREREQQQREAHKPQILDANPELAEAIRYVANDPTPQRQAEQRHQEWVSIIDRAHPGIFSVDIDPELEAALIERRASSDWSDPLQAIADITAEKLAHTERKLEKRYKSDAAKSAQKSAMSVPSPGAGVAKAAPANPDKEAVNRFRNMSDAEFEKERRRVLGL